VILLSKLGRLMSDLTASEAKLEERKKTLEHILSEMKKLPKPKNKTEDIAQAERVEGFLTYMVSHELEDLIEERNWFAGVLLSASILEDLGKRKLERIFAGKIKPEKIDRLTLEQTTMFLLSSGAINQEIYAKLMEIREARNDIAHNSFAALMTLVMKDLSKSEEAKKFRLIIERAIACLKAISPPSIP